MYTFRFGSAGDYKFRALTKSWWSQPRFEKSKVILPRSPKRESYFPSFNKDLVTTDNGPWPVLGSSYTEVNEISQRPQVRGAGALFQHTHRRQVSSPFSPPLTWKPCTTLHCSPQAGCAPRSSNCQSIHQNQVFPWTFQTVLGCLFSNSWGRLTLLIKDGSQTHLQSSLRNKKPVIKIKIKNRRVESW